MRQRLHAHKLNEIIQINIILIIVAVHSLNAQKYIVCIYAFVPNVSVNDVRQLTDSMRSHSPSALNLKLV